MTRIFDHTKQYACTEIFRLEALQEALEDLEELDEDAVQDEHMPYKCKTCSFRTMVEQDIKTLTSGINEFLKNLEEQEKQK